MWTPALGAAALGAEIGEDAALSCLYRLMTGQVPPGELGTAPWPTVLSHIGGGSGTGGFDVSSPRNIYWTRSWAARALAYVGRDDSAAWLRAALEDGHWRVRMTAAQALGRLGVGGSEADLLAVLGDPHPRVRAAAVTALGLMRSPALAGRLEWLMEDESELVRDRVLVALRRLGNG